MSAMSIQTSSSSNTRRTTVIKSNILPNKTKPSNFPTLQKQTDRSRTMGSGLPSKQQSMNGQSYSAAKAKSSTDKFVSKASVHQRSTSASSLNRSSSVSNLSSSAKSAVIPPLETRQSRNNSNQLNSTLNGSSSAKQNGNASASIDPKVGNSRRLSLTREKNLINGTDNSHKSSQKTSNDSSSKRPVANHNNNDTHYDQYYNSSSEISSHQGHRDSLMSTQAFSNLELSPKIVTGSSSIPSASSSRRKNMISEKSGLVGLSNLGNTCFMNSVLQCLSNTKPLLEFVLCTNWKDELNHNSKMKGNLFEAYADLMRHIWETDESYVNPTNFRRLLQKFAPRFMGNAQQDSQEFLRYLLEGLHEDVNRVKQRPKRVTPNYDEEEKLDKEYSRASCYRDTEKSKLYWQRYLKMDNSIIVDLFTGQLMSTLRCTTCDYSSTTFDPFMDLSLPIPQRNSSSPSLSDCFELFTKLEILDGDERPTCSRCKARRRCTKGFTIQCFPKILVIHLKRFSGDRYRSKVSSLIRFPLKSLDLSKFAAKSCTSNSCTYNLYAVSNHTGTVYAGHYTATCKHPKSNLWYDYNDTRVRHTSENYVQSTEAYVLFYELSER